MLLLQLLLLLCCRQQREVRLGQLLPQHVLELLMLQLMQQQLLLLLLQLLRFISVLFLCRPCKTQKAGVVGVKPSRRALLDALGFRV